MDSGSSAVTRQADERVPPLGFRPRAFPGTCPTSTKGDPGEEKRGRQIPDQEGLRGTRGAPYNGEGITQWGGLSKAMARFRGDACRVRLVWMPSGLFLFLT